MAKPLSEAAIKAAQPGDVLKDTVVQGLQLRAFAQSKAFYLYFRTANGTQRKPKLGTLGQITLAQAREAARKMLGEVAMGQDPAAARTEARKEFTLDALWAEYSARYVARKKPTTQDQYLRRYNRSLKAKFGGRKLSDITHQAVEEHHAAIGKAHPTEANHVLILLSGMFAFALSKKVGWTGANPCAGLDKFPERQRRRYMRGEEPAKIAEILDRRSKRNPASVAFIYLLILSGARKSEIAAARWEWLDGNVLNLPDSKTGRKQVYLPPQALEVISRLPRTKPTIVGITRPDGMWERIRTEAGCQDLRLHDLRHSFASAAIGAGFTLAQIGELLGHRNTQTTQRYAHLVEDAAVAAATVTADVLWSKMKKTPAVAG